MTDAEPREEGEPQPDTDDSAANNAGDVDAKATPEPEAPPEVDVQAATPPTTGDETADMPPPQGEVAPDDRGQAVSHELTVDGEAEAPRAAAAPPAEPAAPASTVAHADDTSDVASLSDAPGEGGGPEAEEDFHGDWQTEMSAHRIAVELKRVETRVRELLADRDSRRKRKLAGTYRWHELEEDIIAWRAERRIDSETLEELYRLVCRRHFLFNQLRFAAATRPTWNS